MQSSLCYIVHHKENLLHVAEGEKLGFHPMCLYSNYSRPLEWMKAILDQISIPSLCRHLSEMACTRVGKQCLCDGKVFGSSPGGGNLHDYW